MELSLAGLQELATDFARQLPTKNTDRAYLVGLSGELGAGKTAFVQALARALGVTETVPSPTFTYLRTYPLVHPAFNRLVHIDAYRLSPEEKDALGLAPYFADAKNLLCIEWYENLPSGLWSGGHVIELSYVSPETRNAVIHAEN